MALHRENPHGNFSSFRDLILVAWNCGARDSVAG
jgi:hypothetical protein